MTMNTDIGREMTEERLVDARRHHSGSLSTDQSVKAIYQQLIYANHTFYIRSIFLVFLLPCVCLFKFFFFPKHSEAFTHERLVVAL